MLDDVNYNDKSTKLHPGPDNDISSSASSNSDDESYDGDHVSYDQEEVESDIMGSDSELIDDESHGSVCDEETSLTDLVGSRLRRRVHCVHQFIQDC